MFHSAGYFRAVRCPFYEYGLCHRPHCHYKHAKPDNPKHAANPILKIQPKIQPKLHVSHPPVEKQAENTVPSAESALVTRGESTASAVPEVMGAIQQVSNYFGSKSANESEGSAKESTEPPPPQEKSGSTSESNSHISAGAVGQSAPQYGSTAIGLLSHESIGRLAGEIAEQMVNNPEGDKNDGDIPSYAPEKCIARYDEEGDGKGSLAELAPEQTKENVGKLENMLVSEKDIFGAPLPEGMEDSSEDEAACDTGDVDDTVDIGDTGDTTWELGARGDATDQEGGDVGGVSENVGSSIGDGPSEEEMKAQFQKLTSLTGQLQDGVTALRNAKKRKLSEEGEKGTDVMVKKRRIAHRQAVKVRVRDPVRVEPKSKPADPNFSSMVKQTDLYMGKKRVANQPTSDAAVKRPRLPLNPSAKIAVKVRQKYLDAYIDEHIKMNVPPQDAYHKALEEEKALFESSKNSRGSYLNKSYQTLKQLQTSAEEHLAQQKLASDRRVQRSKEISTNDLIKEGARKESSKVAELAKKGVVKIKAAPKTVGSSSNWQSLNAELQASFSEAKTIKKPASDPASSKVKVKTGVALSAKVSSAGTSGLDPHTHRISPTTRSPPAIQSSALDEALGEAARSHHKKTKKRVGTGSSEPSPRALRVSPTTRSPPPVQSSIFDEALGGAANFYRRKKGSGSKAEAVRGKGLEKKMEAGSGKKSADLKRVEDRVKVGESKSETGTSKGDEIRRREGKVEVGKNKGDQDKIRSSGNALSSLKNKVHGKGKERSEEAGKHSNVDARKMLEAKKKRLEVKGTEKNCLEADVIETMKRSVEGRLDTEVMGSKRRKSGDIEELEALKRKVRELEAEMTESKKRRTEGGKDGLEVEFEMTEAKKGKISGDKGNQREVDGGSSKKAVSDAGKVKLSPRSIGEETELSPGRRTPKASLSWSTIADSFVNREGDAMKGTEGRGSKTTPFMFGLNLSSRSSNKLKDGEGQGVSKTTPFEFGLRHADKLKDVGGRGTSKATPFKFSSNEEDDSKTTPFVSRLKLKRKTSDVQSSKVVYRKVNKADSQASDGARPKASTHQDSDGDKVSRKSVSKSSEVLLLSSPSESSDIEISSSSSPSPLVGSSKRKTSPVSSAKTVFSPSKTVLMELASELFGSDESSDDSLLLSKPLATPSTATPTSPYTAKERSESPPADLGWDDLPRPSTSPTYIVLSSDEEEEEAKAMSFEDALAGVGKPRSKVRSDVLKSRNKRVGEATIRRSKATIQSRGSKATVPGNRKGTCEHTLSNLKEPLVSRNSSPSDDSLQHQLFHKVPSLKLVKARLNSLTDGTITMTTGGSVSSSRSPAPSSTTQVPVLSEQGCSAEHNSGGSDSDGDDMNSVADLAAAACERLASHKDHPGASTSSDKTRETSSSDVPSHQPCGPYISLSKVQVNKVTTDSSHHTHKLSHPKRTTKKVGQVRKPGSEVNQPKNFAVLRKKAVPTLTSELFYSQMWSYLLTEDQLVDNGYPRPTAIKGVASIDRGGVAHAKVVAVGPNAMRHECCRCRKPFIIYNSGQYQTVETCSYHYGRPHKSREYGEGVVSKYSCCQERSGSPGCQLAKLHVTAGEILSQEAGYVETTPSSVSDHAPPDGHEAVYALDCEMCYTTVGLQLTRVSVIDMHLKSVYETLVKPSHTIVDYNTRFSGLTAEDFIGVQTDLAQVQQHLLRMFSSETILVGHSLESDFRALKLIHSRVVDTALVFPHRLGLPYKKALKTLAKDILHKFIQNDIDEGHDSLEDSQACMELMLWKVKGDIKAMCRRSSTS